MRQISMKFVQGCWSATRKPQPHFCLQGIKQQTRDDSNIISSIITSDETWMYGYDPETKQQICNGSSQIHHNWKKPVKFAAVWSPWLVLFFQHPGHCPQGIHTPCWNYQSQILQWGYEMAKGEHLVQMSRQVGEQLISPPWQHACSHITHWSIFPDF